MTLHTRQTNATSQPSTLHPLTYVQMTCNDPITEG